MEKSFKSVSTGLVPANVFIHNLDDILQITVITSVRVQNWRELQALCRAGQNFKILLIRIRKSLNAARQNSRKRSSKYHPQEGRMKEHKFKMKNNCILAKEQ